MLLRFLVLVGAAFAAQGVIAADCAPEGLITLTEWSAAESDIGTALSVTIESGAEKTIRMIDGSVSFTDALGGPIAGYAIGRDVLLEPGEALTEESDWGPYTYERLLVLDPDEVHTRVCIRSVLYDDGTVEKFD